MTDTTFNASGTTAQPTRRDIGIKRRYAAERRFRYYGIAAIAIGVFFLCALLFSVFSKGYTAFQQTMITVPVEFSEQIIDPKNERATNPAKLMTANYPVLARDAVAKVHGDIVANALSGDALDAMFKSLGEAAPLGTNNAQQHKETGAPAADEHFK